MLNNIRNTPISFFKLFFINRKINLNFFLCVLNRVCTTPGIARVRNPFFFYKKKLFKRGIFRLIYQEIFYKRMLVSKKFFDYKFQDTYELCLRAQYYFYHLIQGGKWSEKNIVKKEAIFIFK